MRRSLFLINLVNFVDGIAYFGILGLLTLYLTEVLKFTDPQAHILVSVFTGIVSFSMVFLGGISDRLGIRNGLHLSLVLTVIGRGLLAYCPELPQSQGVAIGALMLMGFAQGIMQPALYAGIKEYSLQGGASMGYSWLYAVMNLGIVAESFISPYIRTSAPFLGLPGLGLGIAGVYKTMFGLTLLLTLINGVLFTKKLEQEQWHPPVKEEGEKSGPSPLREPRFLYFIFILLPVRTLFAHQFMTMPQYIARCFSQDVVDKLEWFNLINPLVVFICTPLFAAVFSKTHVLKVMIGGTFLSAVTTFMLVGDPDVRTLIFYNIVFSIGESLWSSRFLEFIAELAPPGQVGAYMGVGYVPWALAKFTTGFYSGKMIETYVPAQPPQDPSTLWLVYGLIACISPIGLFLAKKWLREVERPAEGNS